VTEEAAGESSSICASSSTVLGKFSGTMESMACENGAGVVGSGLTSTRPTTEFTADGWVGVAVQ
jgi:hypothetical protein